MCWYSLALHCGSTCGEICTVSLEQTAQVSFIWPRSVPVVLLIQICADHDTPV